MEGAARSRQSQKQFEQVEPQATSQVPPIQLSRTRQSQTPTDRNKSGLDNTSTFDCIQNRLAVNILPNHRRHAQLADIGSNQLHQNTSAIQNRHRESTFDSHHHFPVVSNLWEAPADVDDDG